MMKFFPCGVKRFAAYEFKSLNLKGLMLRDIWNTVCW